MIKKTGILFCVLGMVAGLNAGDYYMENILEPDRIATAWMIQQYVDTAAVFHFVEKGSTVSGAVPVDMANSQYRRFPRYSATMCVIRIHKIKDKRALDFAEVIDEIELEFWSAEKSTKAMKLKADLMKIVEESKTLNAALDSAFSYIDTNW